MKRIVGLNRFGYLKRGRMGDAEKSSLTAGCGRKGDVMFQTTHNLDNQECQKRRGKIFKPGCSSRGGKLHSAPHSCTSL